MTVTALTDLREILDAFVLEITTHQMRMKIKTFRDNVSYFSISAETCFILGVK